MALPWKPIIDMQFLQKYDISFFYEEIGLSIPCSKLRWSIHGGRYLAIMTSFILAIRVKITTGYTPVSVPRIPVYIRYICALSPYILPFRSRICAFLRRFPSFALRIPTAHDFCVISARKWARARTKRNRFLSN